MSRRSKLRNQQHSRIHSHQPLDVKLSIKYKLFFFLLIAMAAIGLFVNQSQRVKEGGGAASNVDQQLSRTYVVYKLLFK